MNVREWEMRSYLLRNAIKRVGTDKKAMMLIDYTRVDSSPKQKQSENFMSKWADKYFWLILSIISIHLLKLKVGPLYACSHPHPLNSIQIKRNYELDAAGGNDYEFSSAWAFLMMFLLLKWPERCFPIEFTFVPTILLRKASKRTDAQMLLMAKKQAERKLRNMLRLIVIWLSLE